MAARIFFELPNRLVAVVVVVFEEQECFCAGRTTNASQYVVWMIIVKMPYKENMTGGQEILIVSIASTRTTVGKQTV
jgi:hypothetical protein